MNLVNMQILYQQVTTGAQDSASMTSSQRILTQLVPKDIIGNTSSWAPPQTYKSESAAYYIPGDSKAHKISEFCSRRHLRPGNQKGGKPEIIVGIVAIS